MENTNATTFERGDHVVYLDGTDYGFWFKEVSNIEGMVILENNRGTICVGVTTIKKAN